MTTVLLTTHIIVALSMIVLVLLQRSEGGALGIGGGGGVSQRGLATGLTRTTGVLATIFFLTSIALTFLGTSAQRSSVLDQVIEQRPGGISAPSPIAPPLSETPTLPTP